MQESASSVQADEEVSMAGLSEESSSCLALVVQSPLTAAHAKADVRLDHPDHPCLVSMHAGDAENQVDC